MKKIFLSLLLIISLVFLASCGKADMEMGGADLVPPESWEDYVDKEYGDVSDSNGSIVGGSGSLATESDKKIIKTVRETVETEDYDEFIESLRAAVTAAGGYIASSHYYGVGIYSSTTNRRASFEIRIPAEALEAFNGSVGEIGAVTYYEESANDVTLTYVDITSRIAVLEAEEAALLSILSKAETTADVLAIRSSLSSVQGDLASLRSQKKVIDDKVAYSTVNLTLREVGRVTSAELGFFEEIGNEFSDSLEDIGEGFRGFFVWLIGDSLYILIVCAIATAAFFVLRAVIRRIRPARVKKKTEKDAEKSEQ